jgi:hypothetical protein
MYPLLKNSWDRSPEKKKMLYGSSPDLGFLVIYKVLHKIDREKSYPAGSYPM